MNPLKGTVRNGLKHAEQSLGIDTTYLAKGGFWTALRFVAGIGASIATMVAFGNLLPKESYGTYSYLLSLAASLGFLTLSGLGPVVTRAVARGQENLVRYALSLQLRYNLLATATIAVAGLYYFFKGNSLFAISLGFLALAIPLEGAFHIYEHILIGRKRFDTLALFTILSTLGAAGGTVVALLFTDSPLILVVVYAILSVVPSFFIYRQVERSIPKSTPTQEDKQALKRSAFHITGAGIIGTIAQYADKIILFQVAGPAAVAVYGFATAGPERIKGLLKSWISTALPRLSERNLEEIHSAFYKRVGLSILFGLGAALIYAFLSPLLFKLFLPKYLDSIIYSQLYALGLIFIPALVYIGNIFYSQNMLRAIYITSTGMQIMRIAILVVCGYFWQAWGLVLGFIGFQAVSLVFCIFILEKEFARLKKLNHG